MLLTLICASTKGRTPRFRPSLNPLLYDDDDDDDGVDVLSEMTSIVQRWYWLRQLATLLSWRSSLTTMPASTKSTKWRSFTVVFIYSQTTGASITLNLIVCKIIPILYYMHNALVTCKIKLFWNNFEIISVFYFTRNHHVRNDFKIISAAEIISKLFQRHWTGGKIFVICNKPLR